MDCCKYYVSYRNTTWPSLKAHKPEIIIIFDAFHSVFATFSKKVTIKLVMMLFINSSTHNTHPLTAREHFHQIIISPPPVQGVLHCQGGCAWEKLFGKISWENDVLGLKKSAKKAQL